jgi:acyl-CoA reductase-like NAD-dependent aldehyde dehydrogenase
MTGDRAGPIDLANIERSSGQASKEQPVKNNLKFYIDGKWVEPSSPTTIDVINPSNEEPCAAISAGFARDSQVSVGKSHLRKMAEVLKTYAFEHAKGTSLIVREPIGVVGLITPWNWPLNQITCKVAPAIAAGCTMVLKPSEVAPLNAIIFAQVLHEAGLPAGIFNLVNGEGPVVGAAMAAHPGIDMMSFTGSTRAGTQVAKAAADTVKRVAQELGGKSANILLDDADFGRMVKHGVRACFNNSGQSCNAPTRMFVPREKMDEAARIAKAAADRFVVGAADASGTMLGPVVNKLQFDKVQNLIESGIKEGADLVTGGTGLPSGLNRGYYVKPTVFANVTPKMRIAQEEIFGLLSPEPRSGEGARGRKADAVRQRLHQLPDMGRRPALRRLQAVGERPRVRRVWPRGFHRDQGNRGLRGGMTRESVG